MRRTCSFVMREVGGESLLVPIGPQVMDTNGLVILNDTARCVWEQLAEERSLDELAAAVVERFDVAPDRARADVLTFLDEITRIGMVEQ